MDVLDAIGSTSTLMVDSGLKYLSTEVYESG